MLRSHSLLTQFFLVGGIFLVQGDIFVKCERVKFMADFFVKVIVFGIYGVFVGKPLYKDRKGIFAIAVHTFLQEYQQPPSYKDGGCWGSWQ